MTGALMDNISEFSAELMAILLSTNDLLRIELAIDDYFERKSVIIQNFGSHERKSIIQNLMENLSNEKSNLTINRVLKLVFRLKTDDLNPGDLLKISENPLITKNIIKQYLDFDTDSEIIADLLVKGDYDIQNHIIGLIGKKKKRKYIPELKKIFLESLIVLRNETDLFENRLPNDNKQISKYYEINSFLPEAVEYNDYLNKYIENGKIEESSVDLIKRNGYSFSKIKTKLINKIIHKITLIIECFIDLDSSELLKFTRKLVKILSITSISSSTLNLLDDFNFKLKKMTSLSLFYLGKYGSRQDALFLCDEFPHRDENFNISLIYAMAGFKKNAGNYGFLFKKLKEIAAVDNYYFYALSSMVKIGFTGVEKYISEQLRSKNPRKILLATFFIPYIGFNIQRIEQITLNLLRCKQPLIIRQALWIILKKKIKKTLPLVMNLAFSDNAAVKKDARNLLIKFGNGSYTVMKKRINYYGNERKKILMRLMKQNVVCNKNLPEIWCKL